MIRLQGVRKDYASREALASLDLKIDEGDFVSVVGPSGCGKSTLLRLLAGLETPEAGGLLENPLGPPATGFVFQDAHLMPWRSVEANVSLPLELLGRPRDPRRVGELLSLVGLEGFEKHKPRELSGGMRMRASLARALAGEPRLLLLDEPFAALDEPVRETLEDELLRIAAEKKLTVVFVTHSVAEAVYLGRRVVVFSSRPGRVVLDRRPALPVERASALRNTVAFAEEVRVVARALREGFAS